MIQNFAISCKAFQVPYIIEQMRIADDVKMAWGGRDIEGEQTFIGTQKEWEYFGTKTEETENPYGDRD